MFNKILTTHRHDTGTITPGEGTKGSDIYREGNQGPVESDDAQVCAITSSLVTYRSEREHT